MGDDNDDNDDDDSEGAPVSTTQAPPVPPVTAPAGTTTSAPVEDSVYVTEQPPAPIAWNVPSHIAEAALAEVTKEKKASRTRGVPAGPVFVAAANGMAMALTGAYQAGGVAALAASGVALAGAGAGFVAHRRAVVRKQTAAGARPGAARLPGLRSAGGAGRPGTGGSWLGNAGTGRAAAAGSRAGFAHSSRLPGSARPGTGHRTTSPATGHGNGAARQGNGLPGHKRRTNSAGTDGHARAGARQPGMPGHGKQHRTGHLARIADRLTGGTGRTPAKDSATTRHAATDAAAKQERKSAAQKRLLSAGLGAAKRAVVVGASAGRQALKHTAPARHASGKALRRAAVWTRGAAWDATVAGARGLAFGLWRHSFKVGWRQFRATWKLRREWRDVATAEEIAATNRATAEADRRDALISTSVRRPATDTTFTSASTTSLGAPMSGHHFTASAMEMARAAAAYEPTGMLQVGQDFANLPEALNLVAEAMKITTDKADGEQPLDPQIIELMRGIYQLTQKAAELAGELKPAFENLHHVDLERHRNPRTGERMWDVASNTEHAS